MLSGYYLLPFELAYDSLQYIAFKVPSLKGFREQLKHPHLELGFYLVDPCVWEGNIIDPLLLVFLFLCQ